VVLVIGGFAGNVISNGPAPGHALSAWTGQREEAGARGIAEVAVGGEEFAADGDVNATGLVIGDGHSIACAGRVAAGLGDEPQAPACLQLGQDESKAEVAWL
jgi:hypothetical protein